MSNKQREQGRSFGRALGVGRHFEGYVLKLLRNAGLEVEEAPAGRFADWDVRVRLPDGRELTLEVKADLEEARTGNLAVEYFNPRSGKPSGVAATRADLWVVVTAGLEVFVTRTDRLRAFVRDTLPLRSVSNAGDGNAAIHLYRRDVILPVLFRRLDDLLPAELHELLGELAHE